MREQISGALASLGSLVQAAAQGDTWKTEEVQGLPNTSRQWLKLHVQDSRIISQPDNKQAAAICFCSMLMSAKPCTMTGGQPLALAMRMSYMQG